MAMYVIPLLKKLLMTSFLDIIFFMQGMFFMRILK